MCTCNLPDMYALITPTHVTCNMMHVIVIAHVTGNMMYVKCNMICTTHMLYMLCNTQGMLKICPNLPQIALLYIDKGSPFDYGI